MWRLSLIACVVLAAFVTLAMTLATSGRGDAGQEATSGLGDTTTEADVIQALEGTGYRITYRKMPSVAGYDMLAGEARSRQGVVDFSDVIRLAGPYEGNPQSARSGSPQIPVVRYAAPHGTETIGNLSHQEWGQSPYIVSPLKGGGRSWGETKAEIQMDIRIGVALSRLFAPQVGGEA